MKDPYIFLRELVLEVTLTRVIEGGFRKDFVNTEIVEDVVDMGGSLDRRDTDDSCVVAV